jgi:hypothetical protein
MKFYIFLVALLTSFFIAIISVFIYQKYFKEETLRIGQTWEYNFGENPFDKTIDTLVIKDIKDDYVQFYFYSNPIYLMSSSKRTFLINQHKISDTPLIKK